MKKLNYRSSIISLIILCITCWSNAVLAEREIANHKKFRAFFSENNQCSETMDVIVKHPRTSAFANNRSDLQRLLAGVRIMTSVECPQVQAINVIGNSGGRNVYKGIISHNKNWVLVDQSIIQTSDGNNSPVAASSRQIPTKELLNRNEVVQLQKCLNVVGRSHNFNVGYPDGVLGKKTRNAIVSFQRQEGLAIDGEATVKILSLSCARADQFKQIVTTKRMSNRNHAVTDCDRLAAHPDDPQRVTKGVDWDAVNGMGAIDACEKAIRKYPKEGRLYYQLGRAYDNAQTEPAARAYNKDGSFYGKAVQNFGEAIKLKHKFATGAMGRKLQAGGEFKDAIKYYEIMAREGDIWSYLLMGDCFSLSGKQTEGRDIYGHVIGEITDIRGSHMIATIKDGLVTKEQKGYAMYQLANLFAMIGRYDLEDHWMHKAASIGFEEAKKYRRNKSRRANQRWDECVKKGCSMHEMDGYWSNPW